MSDASEAPQTSPETPNLTEIVLTFDRSLRQDTGGPERQVKLEQAA